MKRLLFIIMAAVLLGAPLAAFAQVDGLSTSGKCRNGRACNLGNTTNTEMIFQTEGAALSVDAASNTVTVTAATTGTATIMGADAAGAADLLIDTTGAGAIVVGSADVTSVTVTSDGGSIAMGAAANTLTLTADGTSTATFIGADATGAANTTLDTTGAGAIIVGSADVTSVTMTTDGASLGVDAAADTLTLTSSGTTTATFTGADAAGASNTLLDTTGAGTITIGSADVTGVFVTTDAGTVTLDGSVKSDVGPLISLASGALTANTVHLATAAADYVLPACEAANIGEWVTVIVQDISEVVVLQPASGDTINPAGAVIDVDHEMDSSGAATGDGDFVTLVCVIADMWFSTGIGGAWVDGGAS